VERVGLGEVGRRDDRRPGRWDVKGRVRHGETPLSGVGGSSDRATSAQST
jgi:hypothetical protein